MGGMKSKTARHAFKLVNKSGLTRQQIADGAGVDINWLDKFKQGRINDPSAWRVEALVGFLDKKVAA